LLSGMCQDGTQCRQGSPDAADATRSGTCVQDAQEAQNAEFRPGESGRNTTVSDAHYLLADVPPTPHALPRLYGAFPNQSMVAYDSLRYTLLT